MKATQQDQTAPELANIVEYLKENPNIFVQHPELLESLTPVSYTHLTLPTNREV